jgi:hypothetical protein
MRPEVEDDWSAHAPYLSRVEPPLAEPKEYSPEYSQFNPSEPSDVQNRLSDQFSPFLTHFQPNQTGSLLF